MTDIGAWLGTLGLEQFADLFRENLIDGEVLADLSDTDLKELGLPLGARKKILKAIATLSEEAEIPPTAAPAASRTEAERRQLTVMFCDLVGSTALSAQLDPEDMREVIRSYQDTCAGVITRFEGFVAKYMGDGVLAYFGYPRAHEDDAERSVRAGRALIEAVAGLQTQAGQPLAARIGIATGLVVVGDLVGEGASQEQAVVGDTPNLAARLQGVAEPGQVVIAEATRRLVGAGFDLTTLGAQALKGLAEPVDAFVVQGERVLESRFDARQTEDLAAMVGRDQELALLVERWRQTRLVEGQMVLLTGEAGIGKSRVVRAAIEAVAQDQHILIRYQCSPYHRDSALHPVIQQLGFAAGFAATDGLDTRLDKLEHLVSRALDQPGEVLRLMAALLELDGEARYGALDLTPQQRRNHTLQALITQLLGLAAQRPVLFVIEDAHWIDPTTLELIELCLDQIAAARVLLLVTARPTFSHSFGGHPIVTQLALNRLGREQTGAIVHRLTGGKDLPSELMDEIAARTDGVPLFVEELTKTVLESGVLRDRDGTLVLDYPLDRLAIPSSLHDSLMARLDRLQPVKEVAQTAACIGREFDYRLLAAVSPLSGEALGEALDRLIAAELVFRRGMPPEAVYTFKHALVRDAAYESLLKARRQQFHGRIVEALEAAEEDAAPEIIAQHAEAAGLTEKALDHWEAAGVAAVARPAYKEAIGHLSNAIRLTGVMGDALAWRERELLLQIQLSQALLAAQGYAAGPTVRAFQRALELADVIGDTPLRFPIYYGNWVARHVASEHASALENAHEMVAAAARYGDDGHQMMAMRMVALSQMMTGAFREAEASFEKALGLYDADRHRALALQFGHEPGIGLHCYFALDLWCLGYPDRAWRMAQEALDDARQMDHVNTLTYALTHVALLARAMRLLADATELSQSTASISTDHGLEMWKGFGLSMHGSALLHAGDDAANALAAMQHGLAVREATDTHIFDPLFHIDHVGALAALGREEEAAAAGLRVEEIVTRGSERWLWAEVRRLQGDLTRRQGGPIDLVEDSYCHALSIAREQGARSWELRAATSLARLWVEQGKRDDAHELLAPIYAWFTEGFGTPDLIEAKRLLDALQ